MPELKSNAESEEQVALRKGQGDPMVMYLVVRETLSMGVGKIAAQCAHASQMLCLSWFCAEESGTEDGRPRVAAFREWINSSFRKVVLRADDKEWEKLKSEDLDFVVVRDAGLTEVDPGSETVIGFWPIRRSEAPKLMQRLQALR